MGDYIDIGGDSVAANQLTIPKARSLAETLARGMIPFSLFIEAKSSEGAESVVLEVEVERPQVRKYRILKHERLAVLFDAKDSVMPIVLSLRPDFPVTPHEDHRAFGGARGLCVFEQPWDEVKLHWGPAPFIGQVRRWLSGTAAGNVHADDQALEPLFLNSRFLVHPPPSRELFNSDEIKVRIKDVADDGQVLIAEYVGANETIDETTYIALCYGCPPVEHGVIHRRPQTLEVLHDLVASHGLNLLDMMREFLRSRIESISRKARLVLLIQVPLKRHESSNVERFDYWAFLTNTSVAAIGEDIGVWSACDGKLGALIPFDSNRIGTNTPIDVLTPTDNLDRIWAAQLNGHDEPDNRLMFAVGAGSLGSQVLETLARSAFGRWALIDEDVLLPHNLARHALFGDDLGHKKASRLATRLNSLYGKDDEFIQIALDMNLLHVGGNHEQVDGAIKQAELIVDFSASVPVERALARDYTTNARRISLFLNPRGTELVLLSEDKDRTVPLDALEMQYYRAITNDSRLADHLDAPQKGRIRYARSCRSLTSRIPQDYVTLFAGIASTALRNASNNDAASILIWQLDPATMSVATIAVDIAPVQSHNCGEWTVVTDSVFIEKVRNLRQHKLPVETGGVILGSFDLTRKLIFIVDTIISPPDSEERPTLYIRGHANLPEMMRDISQRTAANLEYVGEWHSHPDGCSERPSDYDIEAFGSLTIEMEPDGRPAVMLIVAECNEAFYVGQMMRN